MTDRPEKPSDEALRQAIDTARTYATGGTTHWLPCRCLDCSIQLIADTLESELTARTGPTQDLPFRIDFSNSPKGTYMVFVGDTAKLCTRVADARTAETEEQSAELSMPQRVELWDAINDYATACGGRPDKHRASIVRQNAVAAVESIIRAALVKTKVGANV